MLTLAERIRTVTQGDVHVRIWLGKTAFDYRADFAAATNFVHDCRQKHWCAIELLIHRIEDFLPETRLPNERLFCDPQPRRAGREWHHVSS